MCDTEENRELHKQFKKLKIQLDNSNSLIESLRVKNAKLQMELSIQSETYNKKIKLLNDEISQLKSCSQIENYKNLIQSLYDTRKNIGLSSGNINNTLISKQLETEFDIIRNLQSLLTELFDNLYESSLTGKNCDVSFEVQIILDKLNEARNRISKYIKRDEYIVFFKKYREELDSILELLCSKSKTLKPILELSSYEKWILREKDYLYSCEKHSDIYYRIIYLHNPSEKIIPFQLPDKFTEIYFTSDMEHLMKHILITSTNINSICFVEKSAEEVLKNDCFLVLDCISENTSPSLVNTLYWTYDCYLLNTIRNLSKKMSGLFINEFRRFYKDCFGHNNYIHNFQKVLDDKGIKRWKQYKFLYENIRILNDEYMFGEIVRSIIRKNCKYHINETNQSSGGWNNVIKGCVIGSVIKEYTEAQECFNKGVPYIDEQEYFTEVFDDLREFNDKEFNEQYIQRWKDFLKVYYK